MYFLPPRYLAQHRAWVKPICENLRAVSAPTKSSACKYASSRPQMANDEAMAAATSLGRQRGRISPF